MPERDWIQSVYDIKECTQKIIEYTHGMDFKTFSKDEKTIDVVIRNLEVIGEASKNIPDEIRKKYYKIAWKKIAGLRDILIHEYFGINLNIIWDIVTTKNIELNKEINKIADNQ